jgi:nucleoside-diphosphate-sugar epimerase
MDKIIITGSTGFLGSNLIPYLVNCNSEIEVHKLVRNQKTVNVENKEYAYEVFFKNKYQFNSYLHLAGKAHDLKNISDDQNTLR